MTAEVSSGFVFNEQRLKPLQEALCGPMFRHGPHRVVACHQQEVCLGPSQSLLQPGQLTIGIHRTQGASGLLIHKVVRVAAQHYGVEHDDGQGLPRVGDVEVQLVIIRGEFPKRRASCRLRLLEVQPLETFKVSPYHLSDFWVYSIWALTFPAWS